MNFKRKPAVYESIEDKKEQLAKDFLSNAEFPSIIEDDESDADTYRTWKDVCIPKKTIVFSFRVPKKDMQQLKYISARTGLSVNALCLMSVQQNNRKMLKEFEGDK